MLTQSIKIIVTNAIRATTFDIRDGKLQNPVVT